MVVIIHTNTLLLYNNAKERIMFCSNCGTKVDDNARFCPNCGAPAAGRAAQPRQQAVHAEPRRQAAYRQPQRQAASAPYGQPTQNSFMNFLNGSRPMASLPLISLIMFFVFGTYSFYNMITFFGRYTFRFVSFGSWFSVILTLGAAAMFATAFFKKTQKRLFFLIGLAALALHYTVAIISPLWFNIVFGFFILGCFGLIAVYYLFEGKIINHKIKMFACLGFIFFSLLKTIFYSIFIYNFPMLFLFMVPYVALALGFLFYSPYVRR